MTIWHEKNFGAEMQCYATVRALRELGHEVKVIDFRLSDLEKMPLKTKIIQFVNSLSYETASFEEFWKKHIPTTCHYKNVQYLQKNPPVADIYLSGSDQVWNPDITKDKWSYYFLNFGKEETKRVSYASSFGVNRWNWEDKRHTAADLLKRFKCINVRELTGAKLLENEFNLSSSVVLDPTLLHNNYDELTGNIEGDNRSVVYYPLIPNQDLEEFSKKIALQQGLNYINTNEREMLFGRVTWRRTSIYQWIKNIAGAHIVITPSFHGLAFSLIYKRQFVIVQPHKASNRSSRITDLLSSLGLEDRYFDSIEDAWKSKVWERTIDYSDVTPKMQLLKDISWNNLKEALK